MKRQNMSKSPYQQYNGIILIKIIKDSKRKNQKKFTNSFSVDEIDDFSELL